MNKLLNYSGSGKRDPGLDFVRFFAILAVVLNHSVEPIFNMEKPDTVIAWGNTHLHISLLFTIGRMGVPLFLLLSGHLLLHRDYDKPKAMKKFYMHNLLTLVIAWEIWLVLYNIFLAFYNNTAFNFNSYMLEALFVKQLFITHSWYIPMIIGIFIFIPFIAKGLKGSPPWSLYLILSILLAGLFLIPSLNLIFSSLGMKTVSLQPTLGFLGPSSGLYLLIGHLIYLGENRVYKKIKLLTVIQSLTLVICIYLTVRFQGFIHANFSPMMNEHREYLNLWYDFILLPPIAWASFHLLRRVRGLGNLWIIRRFSITSFGIYLIHRPLQMLMTQKDSGIGIFKYYQSVTGSLSDLQQMWVHFLVSLLISFVIVELIGRIPFIGWLLFRIKSKKQ